ncbi:MAG: sulfotransferase [Planctomycetota bacterium]
MTAHHFITVVSGLPRSGTSMMMQALNAGGIPPLTDGERTADDDNPHGYYELECAKQIKKSDAFLDDALGKAVKLIHLLVTRLPARHEARVVFMRRDIDEVLASQAKMLVRSGKQGGAVKPEVLKGVFTKQLKETMDWLVAQPNIQVLEVGFREMFDNPTAEMDKIAAFLGGGLDVDAMARAVDPSLYRNRQPKP